ncbi:hypothetical protein [Caulobacter sp. S45]|uniref:hypothetical protein n=1 Tax=Caulobacter sp. S45 TaxID=1641861 RepID=UPI001C2D6321|nr:hypothetical protein [Caulobacter sp. S45]
MVDNARLLADLRALNPVAIAQAYRMTFGGQVGRFVLTHWMADCGVGRAQGPGVSAEDRTYLAGRHDAAIDLMSSAGFDQPSAVLATLTEQLGDMDNERYAPDTGYAATGIDASEL